MVEEELEVTPRDKGIILHEPSAPKKCRADNDEEPMDYIARWGRLITSWLQKND